MGRVSSGELSIVRGASRKTTMDATIILVAIPPGWRGGGVRPGISFGETDEYSYNIVKDPVPVRNFNATILHCLGIDHNRLTFRFQGLDQKLTTPVPASVVDGLLA